ncbi:Uncharacterised protein [Mycobacteroides abscessus subsp. abscessus]|nr:Uncharacterised protein [Mycobacteroides abscessus subsp. abscessus]
MRYFAKLTDATCREIPTTVGVLDKVSAKVHNRS